METLPTRVKYDLKPWLNAKTTRVFVVVPFQPQTELALNNQISSLFSYFLPNLHAIVLVSPDFMSQSMLAAGLLKKYGQRVHLLPQNKGDSKGVALLRGITTALDQGADKIIQLSGLAGTETRFIPEMIRYADQYDLILGSRFIDQQEFLCPQKQWQYSIDRWVNASLLQQVFGRPGIGCEQLCALLVPGGA